MLNHVKDVSYSVSWQTPAVQERRVSKVSHSTLSVRGDIKLDILVDVPT